MLGFFTDPYPDELLYSALARYDNRAKYPNRKTTVTNVFGSDKFSAIIDFPTRLQMFIDSFHKSDNYTTDNIIDKHTLLPFYEPFLPREKVEIIRAEMAGSTENKIHSRLGIRVNQIENPKYLRFCPLCADDDRELFGETYWHRIHQIAGILVCRKHNCFLENSRLQWDRKTGQYFHAAEKFIKNVPPAYIDDRLKSNLILLKLAEDAEWLLSNTNLKINNKNICDRHFNILLEKGFAYYNGRIRHTKFIKTCDEFFPADLFDLIGRVSIKDNWLSALVQSSLSNKNYHPIRHLLLMTFSGLTAKQFFTEFVEFKPFGEALYPCLNQASNHYNELRIQNCEVFDNLTKGDKYRRPIAIFECDCGFIYQRLGPDKSEADKFRFSSIREYGKVWEKKFTELWKDLSISSAEIGRKIGTSSTSVGRHAIRLNLPMNTPQTRSLEGYKRHRNPRTSFSEMLKNYRERWLQTLVKHPTLTRQELMNTENFLYLWLRRNDSEWFEKTLPKSNKPNRKNVILDWKIIDKEYSSVIRKVCAEIISIDNCLIRVSITEVARRAGKKVWLEKRGKKLPKTSKILDEKLESLEDFMCRKGKWAKEFYIKEKIIPTKLQLKVKAVVRNHTSDTSTKVQKVIEDSLQEIKILLTR
jgi:Tn7-like transposition protein D/TniQ